MDEKILRPPYDERHLRFAIMKYLRVSTCPTCTTSPSVINRLSVTGESMYMSTLSNKAILGKEILIWMKRYGCGCSLTTNVICRTTRVRYGRKYVHVRAL
jgi:hypothetical protein